MWLGEGNLHFTTWFGAVTQKVGRAEQGRCRHCTTDLYSSLINNHGQSVELSRSSLPSQRLRVS